MTNEEILDKYIDLIDNSYCSDCNELNCIDNFPHSKITHAIRELQQENAQLKNKLKDIEKILDADCCVENVYQAMCQYLNIHDFELDLEDYLKENNHKPKTKEVSKMRYFYEYKYKNGNRIVGGHNLEKIEFYDNYIKLLGVDIIPTNYDYEKQHWGTLLDMNEIEYLKIEPMKKESGE